MAQQEQIQQGGPIRFGAFFCSSRPNGYIGCLEYLILAVIGWLGYSIASALIIFIFGITWGIGVFAAGAVMTSDAASYTAGAGSIFSLLMLAIGSFCFIAATVLFALYNAKLLQLRLIDIGLGEMLSVPGLGSKFSVCFVAALICSFINLLGFALLVFCCVCQGKTYRDNRDLFAPIQKLPPADELARQMHRRKSGGA